MKIKTSELIGPALDWAVAKCEGKTLVFFNDYFIRTGTASGASLARVKSMLEFQPLKDKWCWLNRVGGAGALSKNRLDGKPGPLFYAKTPLIAAMRCYVASRLGDEIEIPDGIVGEEQQ